MKPTTLVIAAALATGCMVHNDERSLIVGTKLIAATLPTGSTASGCVYDASTAEATFGAFDPAFGYVHAVVVENRLPDNSGRGPGRLNSNDFQVEGATITTEVLVGPAQTIAQQTVPANGLIKTAQAGPVSVVLAQPGAITGAATVRFNIQIFGHLIDGSSAKSNRYEYSADAIPGFVLPTPTCTAPAVAVVCEGTHQDTTAACK